MKGFHEYRENRGFSVAFLKVKLKLNWTKDMYLGLQLSNVQPHYINSRNNLIFV